MSEEVEAVVKNVAILGEGPHWDEPSQCLYYVDTFSGNVNMYNPATGENKKLALGERSASIIIPREKGGFVVSQTTDVAILESWDTGAKLTSIATLESGNNMLNDGKVDNSGRLWIGSCYMGKDVTDPDKWPKGHGSLYSVDPDGTARKHMGNITISNGMDWSNDGRTMYYIDSIPKKIWGFDFDVDAGRISNQRTVADFSASSDIGYPDGMTVDAEDKIWMACYGAGKVVRIDPETGKVIRTVNIPAFNTTSCCFGGDDFSDLYVTSANRLKEDTEKMPLSGSLFKVKSLGIKGRRSNKFAG